MTAPIRIDSNLPTILYFTLARLIAQSVCNPTTGMIGQNEEDNFVPPSPNYVIVSGEKQNLINAEAQTWGGIVKVRPYAYSALDIAMRDNINIIQPNALGIGPLVNGVIDALNMYDATNGAFYYLAQPMRYIDQDKIYRKVRAENSGLEWSFCDIYFEIVYGEDPTYVSPNAAGIGEYNYEYNPSYIGGQ